MQMKIIIILVEIFFSIAIAKPNNMTEKTIPYSTTINADSSKSKKKTSSETPKFIDKKNKDINHTILDIESKEVPPYFLTINSII